jgi:hypothetical protein
MASRTRPVVDIEAVEAKNQPKREYRAAVALG